MEQMIENQRFDLGAEMRRPAIFAIRPGRAAETGRAMRMVHAAARPRQAASPEGPPSPPIRGVRSHIGAARAEKPAACARNRFPASLRAGGGV